MLLIVTMTTTLFAVNQQTNQNTPTIKKGKVSMKKKLIFYIITMGFHMLAVFLFLMAIDFYIPAIIFVALSFILCMTVINYTLEDE